MSVVLMLFLGLWTQAEAGLRIGLVLDKGGKDDKSFNAGAYRGAQEAEKKFGVQLKTVEAADDNAYEALLKGLARKNFDLVIAVGVAQVEAVGKVAPQFPNTKFALVDAEVKGENVRNLLFQEHEGSYLVGALAALTSKTGRIGFVGGMDTPLIRRFQLGYESGAKAMNPRIKVSSNYVGVTGSAWNNPAKGKELAMSQYNSGTDIVFAAAGASGLGVFDAAEEKKLLAIGVDSNQNWIKPGRILTSMLKRVDVAVFDTIESLTKNQFQAGSARYGLSNSGIDLAIDDFNRALLDPKAMTRVDQLKKQILSAKLKVPDYYEKR